MTVALCVQAVLINGQTASTSELLASALRHGRRASLVGGRTLGKGRSQRSFQLADGSTLAVTVLTFSGADGAPLDRVGLQPDVHCDVSGVREVAWRADADGDLRSDPCLALAADKVARVAASRA